MRAIMGVRVRACASCWPMRTFVWWGVRGMMLLAAQATKEKHTGAGDTGGGSRAEDGSSGDEDGGLHGDGRLECRSGKLSRSLLKKTRDEL